MKFKYFCPHGFKSFIDKCKSLFLLPELSLIYSFSYNGIERRLEQIVQDYPDEFNAPILHIRFSLECEDPADVETLLVIKTISAKKDKVYLFCSGIEHLLQTKNAGMIPWLIKMQNENNNFRVILFSEMYISSQDASILGSIHVVGNVYYYPLFSKADSLAFVEYLQEKWKMNLPERKKNYIIKQCGGQFWLLKQSLRILYNNLRYEVENLYNHEAIQYRLSALYARLSEKEKAIIFNPRNNGFINTRNYLSHIHLLEKNKCTIPLLTKYVQENWKRINIVIEKKEILFNNVQVTYLFSKTEFNILKFFVQNANKPISRDEISKILWKTNADEKYSDWAIDQGINRLRKKLQKLGIGKNVIKTVRSFGYTFNY